MNTAVSCEGLWDIQTFPLAKKRIQKDPLYVASYVAFILSPARSNKFESNLFFARITWSTERLYTGYPHPRDDFGFNWEISGGVDRKYLF